MIYDITVKKWSEPNDEYYVIEVPEIKGCITHGYTIKEAFEMIKDAIKCCLELDENENIELGTVWILENFTESEKKECYDAYEKTKIIIRQTNIIKG